MMNNKYPDDDRLIELAINTIYNAIYNEDSAPVPEELHPYTKLTDLLEQLTVIKSFALSIANGDLSSTIYAKGYLVGALKALQANLRHLTWQTQAIANGDFNQRVDFLGDFSLAFNHMVDSLARETTARRQAEAELQRLATTDEMTGLYNRRYFLEMAGREWDRFSRYDQPFSVLILDIDRFKGVNDTYGHDAGDQVLQLLAGRVAGMLRVPDILGRIGGEEFAVLLPGVDQTQAMQVAERLRAVVADEPLVVDGSLALSITISIGVATALNDHKDFGDILRWADKGLYLAKNSGRNCVKVYPMTKSLPVPFRV